MIVSLASTTAAIIEIYMLGSGQSVMWITAAVIVGSASISGYSIPVSYTHLDVYKRQL